MNELKKGLEFALKHGLSPKEMEILLIFMQGSNNATKMAQELGVSSNNISSVITRLKLKGLIKSSQDGQFKVYSINL